MELMHLLGSKWALTLRSWSLVHFGGRPGVLGVDLDAQKMMIDRPRIHATRTRRGVRLCPPPPFIHHSPDTTRHYLQRRGVACGSRAGAPSRRSLSRGKRRESQQTCAHGSVESLRRVRRNSLAPRVGRSGGCAQWTQCLISPTAGSSACSRLCSAPRAPEAAANP